jgi:hypothetical protein
LVTTCKENGQVRKKSTRERKTLLKNGLMNSSCLCASFNSDSQSTNSGADLQREDSQ